MTYSHTNRMQPTEADMLLVASIIEDQKEMATPDLYDLIGTTLYARGMFSGAALQIAYDELCKARNVQ